LQEALNHKPAGLSNPTSSYYSYLSTFLKITPKTESDKIEEHLVLSKTYPKEVKDSLNLFWPEYQKKKNGEDYDKAIYKWGKLRFWPPIKEELEEKLLSLQIERIHKLSHHKRSVVAYVSQPDELWGREKYLTKATPVLEESWFNTQLHENLERDQKRVAKLAIALDEEAELDIPHKLGRKVLELENDVEFFMANHESVEALMTSIQEAHKDTAIIFDIWATWCGPCLLDMRGSKDMKKQLADLPVKVVYLCLSSHGSNPKDWKRLIADMEISGEHIFLEEDLYKAFAKKYEISYYPTYLFMDKEGNIDRNLVQRIAFINLEQLKKHL
ncbi:MAG: TlpA disulfide reductase family protein, partial [Bacteroidota bacterium]